jgi:LPXTG-motif cell wall-anchored protein
MVLGAMFSNALNVVTAAAQAASTAATQQRAIDNSMRLASSLSPIKSASPAAVPQLQPAQTVIVPPTSGVRATLQDTQGGMSQTTMLAIGGGAAVLLLGAIVVLKKKKKK